jgi:hypothetical protein
MAIGYHEPALKHVREKIVGGLLTPKDETGCCFKSLRGWRRRLRIDRSLEWF